MSAKVAEHGHHPATAHSDKSADGSLEKETAPVNPNASSNRQDLENIRTVSRVPGNPNYYEKDGLRTYGDDEDHDHEPPVRPLPHTCVPNCFADALLQMSMHRLLSLVAMAFLWTASQIPLYLFGECSSSSECVERLLMLDCPGGIPPYIYGELGGTDRWVWFVLANLLALAAVCPFVGALSDLMGRRYVALAGASFIILGMIICSTAHTMNTFICKFYSLYHDYQQFSANLL